MYHKNVGRIILKGRKRKDVRKKREDHDIGKFHEWKESSIDFKVERNAEQDCYVAIHSHQLLCISTAKK